MHAARRRVDPLPFVLPLVLLLVMLHGCAVLNEGAVNYRKQKIAAKGGTTPETLELVKKYDTTSLTDKAILAARSDTVSIHLAQGFIKDFFDLPSLRRLEMFGAKRGEIAVVIKVTPLGDNAEMKFSAEALNSGRLIYYNDDVRKDQYLNFSYLPVYGPVTYDGKPLAIQIYIIEMDASDAQLKPLLHTLATIGSSLYAPAAPILSLLDSLGSALLSGNTDDILMRYSMTLYPGTGMVEANYPVLEVGNYVLVRRGNRNEGPARQGDTPAFDWDRVTFDPREGRLVWADAPGTFFTDETYLVLQVQKGFTATTMQDSTTYVTFRDTLAKAAEASGQTLADAAKAFTDQSINQAVYASLHNKIKEICNAAYLTEESTRFMAWNFVSELAVQTKKMNEADAAKKIGALTSVQFELLLSLLAEASDMTTDALTTALKGAHDAQKTIVEAIVDKKQATAKGST